MSNKTNKQNSKLYPTMIMMYVDDGPNVAMSIDIPKEDVDMLYDTLKLISDRANARKESED